jgi:membrane protease YdiL (CAAX protease family)
MSERPPGPTRGRLAGWLALVGVLTALAYAANFATDEGDLADEDFFYRWDSFIGTVVQEALVVAVLVWIVYRGPAGTLLALRRPPSWGGAGTAMLLVFVAILVLGAALNPVLHPGEEQGLVPDEWRSEEAAPFAANFALTTLLVPVVEELTFRGAGYSLLARYGKGVAIVGSGILFGAVHGLVLALPVLVAFGIGLAWLRGRTGSVYPGIVLHALFNAVAVLVGTFA